MPKEHGKPPPDSAGDVLKDAYDQKVEDGFRGVASRVRSVALSGFGKGALVTGLAIIAVAALMTGYAALGGAGGVPVATLEEGIAKGISSALQFMTSGMGLGTLAAGGMAGMASDVIHNQQKISAQQTQKMALEHQHMQEHEKSRQHEKTVEKAPQKEHKESPDPHIDTPLKTRSHQDAPAKKTVMEQELEAAAKTPQRHAHKTDEHKKAGFQAAELKRRSEAPKNHEIGTS